MYNFYDVIWYYIYNEVYIILEMSNGSFETPKVFLFKTWY